MLPAGNYSLQSSSSAASETGDQLNQQRVVFKQGLDTKQLAVIGGIVVGVGVILFMLRK